MGNGLLFWSFRDTASACPLTPDDTSEMKATFFNKGMSEPKALSGNPSNVAKLFQLVPWTAVPFILLSEGPIYLR